MTRHAAISVLAALLLVACAQGGDDRRGDAGGGADGDVPMDATATSDAMPDAAPALDADTPPDDAAPGVDGGPPDGPIACTAGTAGTVCGGRSCVDGYCCDSACTGSCQGCDVAGLEGTCTLFDAGTDPANECGEQAMSTCGTSGACDGAGACAFYDSTVSCDDGEACTTDDSCDGSGGCAGDAPSACGPGSGNECCVGTCTDGGGCSTLAGSCTDTCGSAELTIGATCNGCGAAGAVGLCQGAGTHRCDETNHNLCQELTCGGVAYFCTSVDGSWAWRPSAGCDDGLACTHSDTCGSGSCSGTAIDCSDTTCADRECNGSATCSVVPNTGTACEDGDLCTFNDMCNASGVCSPGPTVTCDDGPCIDRACDGSATCVETTRTGMGCDDGDPCTSGTTCTAGAACTGGATLDCDAMDTTCEDFSCDGSASCASAPRNLGMMCDDGDAGTDNDVCLADGSCEGTTCPVTLASAFADAFGSPSSSSWTNGTDVAVNTSQWNAYTTAGHGVRITGGRLEITNQRSSSAGHGNGYAYVRTSGVGTDYDNSVYNSTLANNAGSEVVWTVNMRRDDPDSTDGGFDCSSTSNQNGRTVGMAYVLAGSSAAGLNASTSTCGPSATAFGYAVVMGGSRNVRLVRFSNGLRNGTVTNIVTSSNFSRTTYYSVRVTYNAVTNLWRLEARDDGSNFANPSSGSYSSTGTGTDATYVGMPLDFAGPYFQTGCTGLCDETYTTRFDNATVGVRCAP